MKNTKPKPGKLASRISAFESVGGTGAGRSSPTPGIGTSASSTSIGTNSADNSNSSINYIHTTPTTKQLSKEEKIRRESASNLTDRITAFEEGNCNNSSTSIDFLLSPIAGKDKLVLDSRKGSVVTIVKEFNSVEEANIAAMKKLQEKMERRRQYRKKGKKQKKKPVTGTSSSKKSTPTKEKKEKKHNTKKKNHKAATVNDTKGVWRNVQATPNLTVDPKTYKVPKQKVPKNAEQEALIRKTIDETVLLGGNTTQKFKDALVNAFESVVVQPGEILIPKQQKKNQTNKKNKEDDEEEGDSYFYIVQQGKVDVKLDGRTVDTVQAGDTFGELNLLYNAVQVHDGTDKKINKYHPTIMASLDEDSDLDTRILRLDQTAYRGIVQNFTKQEELEKTKFIEQNPILKAMIPKDDPLKGNITRNKLTSIMKPITFSKNDTLVEEEQVGNTLFVVQEGKLRVQTPQNQMAEYGPNDCFGKRALGTTTNEPKQVKITSVETGTGYSIDKTTLDKVLGENHLARTKAKVQDTQKLSGFQCIKKVNLDNKSLEELASRIEDETFDSGKTLFEQGKQVKPCLYLVREGTVTLTTDDGKFKQEIKAGGYFGVEQLLAPSSSANAKTPSINSNTTLPAQWNVTVSKDKPCVLGILPLLECQKTLDKKDKASSINTSTTNKEKTTKAKPIKTPSGDIKKAPVSAVAAHRKQIVSPAPAPAPAPSPPAPEEKEEDDDDISPILKERAEMRQKIEASVTLKDLERLSVLGEGEFGEVWLVAAEVSKKKHKFALKIQRKEPDNPAVLELIRREIHVTQTLCHPFIVNLVTTYEEPDSIHMLMGLVTGGELWDQVHQEDADGNWSSGVPESHAKFYAILIADTLKYMHDQNYLYRDLKPENVMIDGDGYPIIVDFGFAKQTKEKTYTFCGTPNYVAPEIVQNVGHHVGADHWALGVLIYEMVSGEHPFYYDGMDQVTLFEAIVEETHYAVQTNVSKEAIDIIELFLEKDPVQRLGVLSGGSKDILNHKWFKGMDLMKLRAKKVKAPWVPPK